MEQGAAVPLRLLATIPSLQLAGTDSLIVCT